MFRQLISKVFVPNLEKDLTRAVGREVAKMESTTVNFAPQVYGYRPKITSAMGGAFGTSTPMRQQQQIMTRVDIPFKANLGLFHE
ncbi:hypothetical protein ACHAWU_007722 [Discostella pseudostelligera]|uniref:Uncharacterized protein n=1 Tax=Discostella pseudostelligera TaxID=259834 RepID=A0ABD3M2B8_9STRA